MREINLVEKPKKKNRITLYVTDLLKERLSNIASFFGVSVSTLCSATLEHGISGCVVSPDYFVVTCRLPVELKEHFDIDFTDEFRTYILGKVENPAPEKPSSLVEACMKEFKRKAKKQ